MNANLYVMEEWARAVQSERLREAVAQRRWNLARKALRKTPK
jgi:hypothetical protein